MGLDVVLIGQRIKSAREEADISLSGLAGAAELAKSYVLKLERGEVPNPGLATLSAIAHALKLSLGQLLAPPLEAGLQPEESASEWERLAPAIPASLSRFLEARERAGQPVRADMKVALAKVRYRGRQPATEEDWMFVMSAIQKSVGSQPQEQDATDDN